MRQPGIRNRTIDLLKFVFSLCIIGVHINLFIDINTVAYRAFTQALFRIGVPFYFIVSGWFFADRLADRKRSDAWLLKLIRIYVIFEIIDILLTVPVMRSPIGYIILRIFTTGLNRIYWYLVSLILTCLLCRELWRKGYTVHLISAGLLLYLLTMTYDSYSFLFENTVFAKIGAAHTFVWAWPQAGFGESVLFLSIGVWLKQKLIRVPDVKVPLIISLICLIAEGSFCQAMGAADANCCFSLLPVSVLLFLWTLDHPDFSAPREADRLGLYIYMTHIYYSYVSAAVSQNTVIRFVLIAGLSLLTSYLIVKLKKKPSSGS